MSNHIHFLDRDAGHLCVSAHNLSPTACAEGGKQQGNSLGKGGVGGLGGGGIGNEGAAGNVSKSTCRHSIHMLYIGRRALCAHMLQSSTHFTPLSIKHSVHLSVMLS